MSKLLLFLVFCLVLGVANGRKVLSSHNSRVHEADGPTSISSTATSYIDGLLDMLYPVPNSSSSVNIDGLPKFQQALRHYENFINVMEDPFRAFHSLQIALCAESPEFELDNESCGLLPEAIKCELKAKRLSTEGHFNEAAKLRILAASKVHKAVHKLLNMIKSRVPAAKFDKLKKRADDVLAKDDATDEGLKRTAHKTAGLLDTASKISEELFLKSSPHMEKERLRLLQVTKTRSLIRAMLGRIDKVNIKLNGSAAEVKSLPHLGTTTDDQLDDVKKVIETYEKNPRKYKKLVSDVSKETANPKVPALEDIDNAPDIPSAEKKILKQINFM